MFVHKFFVRYAETDQMGVVYYANYLVYFESARTALFKDENFSYRTFEKNGIFIPVIEAYCKYFSPAFYEDTLEISLQVSEIKNSYFTISYNVQREGEQKILATGYTKHCCVNKEMKPVRVPDELKKILIKHKK